tara:strand:- start:1030 stop:1260 length:231 start_codon:yes stop_codon:yes gene_type:complete
MGRMKDLHIDMLNDHWDGDPNEYLKIRSRESEVIKSEILCPNCLVDMLIQENQTDLDCIHCGFDFVKINHNTVRYK